jgi:AcrR family transcriptional regulator
MTLYNHFASKEELIVAVLEKRDREILATLGAAMDRAGRTPARRLSGVFDWLGDFLAAEEFNGCAFIRALSEYPEQGHPIHQVAWRHKQAVLRVLNEIASTAGAKNAGALAETWLLLLDGAIVSAHASGSAAAAAGTARAAAVQLLKLALS